MRLRPNSKMVKFALQLSGSQTMEKKDYIILAAALVFAGLSLYRKYAKKHTDSPLGKTGGGFGKKRGLGDQPDDYEPYSGKK